MNSISIPSSRTNATNAKQIAAFSQRNNIRNSTNDVCANFDVLNRIAWLIYEWLEERLFEETLSLSLIANFIRPITYTGTTMWIDTNMLCSWMIIGCTIKECGCYIYDILVNWNMHWNLIVKDKISFCRNIIHDYFVSQFPMLVSERTEVAG